MATLELYVKRPPTVNMLYANAKTKHGGKGRFKTAKYMAWTSDSAFTVKQQMGNWACTSRDVRVHMDVDKKRADLQNLEKAPFDLMTHCGVYDDDSQVVELSMKHVPECGDMMFIVVEEL